MSVAFSEPNHHHHRARKKKDAAQPRVSPAAATVIAMISILAQERLLGFALGSVSMGGFVLHQRRAIYRSLAEADGSPYAYQVSIFVASSEPRKCLLSELLW
nr:unnamed protein product [Digitaria exilis]